MQAIPQDQSSEEWKNWRKNRIGASDIAVILGISPWSTPHELWRRKLGFTREQVEGWAMARGTKLEPIARAMANEQLGANFEPAVLTHKDLEWASASLDGIDRKKGMLLEIKCPGRDAHQKAQRGQVPDYYVPQVQWQLFVADLQTLYYASYYDTKLEIIKVERDDRYIVEVLLPAATEFYRCMVDMEEPTKTDKEKKLDNMVEIVDPEFAQCLTERESAKEMVDFYKKKMDFYTDKIVGFTDDGDCYGHGFTITRVQRKSCVDWKKMYEDMKMHYPELSKLFCPDSYRKEQIGFWSIKKDKA